jgi:hypothetical protein
LELLSVESEKPFVLLDGDQHGARLVAPRDDELVGLSALESIERLGELTGGGTRREDLVKPNAQHSVSLRSGVPTETVRAAPVGIA